MIAVQAILHRHGRRTNAKIFFVKQNSSRRFEQRFHRAKKKIGR
jgi:hypothetical protein